ncbi:MAG TPA: ATP-binding protein, partial [Roseiflexaceae bacterium]
LSAWHSFPVTAPAPLAESVRTGTLVLLESEGERAARYPNIGPVVTADRAWAAMPLVVDGRTIGGLGLSFAVPRTFDADDRSFMLALAQQCAQALDRARLFAAERNARAAAEVARERLEFLSEVSTLLSSSLDYETTLVNVARLATPVLADWCVIDVIDDDGGLRRVAVAHADPAKRELAQVLLRFPPRPSDTNMIYRALRSGEPVVVPEVSNAMLADAAQDAEHLQILREIGVAAFVIMPLLARARALGAISCVVAESNWRYGAADLALIEELARRAATAIENARLYRETQAAVRARDELLSIVSHDLRNPLAFIRGQAQLLARRAVAGAASDPGQLVEGLARIGDATARMGRLIGDLLDLARLQAGQALDLDRRSADLVALARQIAAERQQETDQHHIAVTSAEPRLLAPIDAARVERALDNLLSNAIKYSPRGGEIAVEIAREQESGASWAVLVVRDQGLGIAAADLPYIFERFRRGNNVGTIGGTGIGLSSVRQVVEQHGGTIAVASEEGRGATFTVRLPLDIGCPESGVRSQELGVRS